MFKNVPCGCAELSSIEVVQLCWWRASSLFKSITTVSDRNEWLETSWEKYWDNSASELRDPCFRIMKMEERWKPQPHISEVVLHNKLFGQIKQLMKFNCWTYIKITITSLHLFELKIKEENKHQFWGLGLDTPTCDCLCDRLILMHHLRRVKSSLYEFSYDIWIILNQHLLYWQAQGISSWSSWEQGNRLPACPSLLGSGSYRTDLQITAHRGQIPDKNILFGHWSHALQFPLTLSWSMVCIL